MNQPHPDLLESPVDLDVALHALYDDLPISDEAFDEIVDRSLDPRPAGMLFEQAIRWGLSSQSRLLDIGCRDAGYAAELVTLTGCSALAVDPLPDHLRRAQRLLAERQDVAHRIEVRQGRVEEIPAATGSIDFIWCRDVLNHVPDLARGLNECARVLSPGGRMLSYQTFSTELLEPKEAEFLYRTLAIVPANQSSHYFEQTATAAGFQVLDKDEIGSEWREHWEETGAGVTSQQLLRAARLRRDRQRIVAAVGEFHWQAELANCLWGIYQMIGKLCPTIYVLERA